jgi:pheromone shutdown protein TraB
MVSAAIELWARKPRVGDFEALRDDLASLKGWWRNRVSRVFLVFFFTNLGTSIGAWIGGFQLVKRLSSLL